MSEFNCGLFWTCLFVRYIGTMASNYNKRCLFLSSRGLHRIPTPKFLAPDHLTLVCRLAGLANYRISWNELINILASTSDFEHTDRWFPFFPGPLEFREILSHCYSNSQRTHMPNFSSLWPVLSAVRCLSVKQSHSVTEYIEDRRL